MTWVKDVCKSHAKANAATIPRHHHQRLVPLAPPPPSPCPYEQILVTGYDFTCADRREHIQYCVNSLLKLVSSGACPNTSKYVSMPSSIYGRLRSFPPPTP